MKRRPTQRQGEVVHFIEKYIQTHKQEERPSRIMNLIIQDRLVSKGGTYFFMNAVKIPIWWEIRTCGSLAGCLPSSVPTDALWVSAFFF